MSGSRCALFAATRKPATPPATHTTCQRGTETGKGERDTKTLIPKTPHYSDYCLELVDTSSGDWLVSNMSPVTSLLYIFLLVDINISCVHPQPDTSHVFVP